MKETTRFYSSLGLLVVLNAIVKPLWIFGIDRQVQNEVGTAVYGAYFSLFNLSIVFSFLLDWGLTYFYNRQLSAKENNVSGITGTLISVKLLMILLYAGVVFCIALSSGIKRLDIVLYVVLIQALTSLFVFFRAIITAQQWFRTDAWLSVLDKALMIAGCGIFLYIPSLWGKMNIVTFLLLQIGCTAIALFTALLILIQQKFYFSFKRVWPSRQIFRTALPFAVIVLLMSFHSRIDGFLLDRMRGPEEAGKYAAAYRLLDAANMIGYLFASFLLPYIARSWTEKRNIQPVVLTIRHLLLVFSIAFSAFIFFEASWIQHLLYHQDDPDSIKILQWCMPALIGYALVQVYGTVMTATGHVVAFIYISSVAVLINLSLNLLLIPSFGAKASCLAALTSQFFCGIATMLYCRQKINTVIDGRSGLIYIFIATALCAFLYVVNNLPVNKWLLTGGVGLLVLIIVWITKLVDPSILKSSSS